MALRLLVALVATERALNARLARRVAGQTRALAVQSQR
jgi:hypothetical protein